MVSWTKPFVVEAAPDSFNDGDKIILPSSALEELLANANNNSESLPSPLTFEIRHPHTRTVVHGGVKEFSGEAETAKLPQWMLDTLQLQPRSRAIVRLRLLQKGSWARLRPLSWDYKEITDYRAAFEAHLRTHYNTLTVGQVLNCRYGSKTYPFLVVDLKPDQAVCITDTDLEVDLEPMEEEQREAKTSVLPNHNHGEKIKVSLNEPIDNVKVAKGEYKYWELQLEEPRVCTVEMNANTGDADLLVDSAHRKPTLDNYEWSDLSSDKQHRVNLVDISTKVLYVGIHGYSDSVVSWKASAYSPEDNEATLQGNDPNAYAEGYTQCSNCKAWIPERTRMLHEGFCQRNNILCPQGCGRVLKKGSEEAEEHWHCSRCGMIGSIKDKKKHDEYHHTPKTCTCGEQTFDSYNELARHRRTDCPERLITCRFCHNLVPQGPQSLDPRDRLLNLRSHESYCGSRTITCQKCKRQIPIKDIQIHAKIHEVERQNQKLPPLCSNKNCIRPRANNKLGLCQYCFGPFWATDDDPNNIKLIQRVARKLHSQLTVGCGKPYCHNPYCATCTQKPQDANTAATTLVPIIASLQRQLRSSNPDIELYLCVDETVTRKRFLAETLAESTGGKYGIDWCIKAIENENEDLERARHWLEANAPKRI